MDLCHSTIRRLVNLGVWIWRSLFTVFPFYFDFLLRLRGSMGETVTCYPFSTQHCVVIIDKEPRSLFYFWFTLNWMDWLMRWLGFVLSSCAFFMCCILLAYCRLWILSGRNDFFFSTHENFFIGRWIGLDWLAICYMGSLWHRKQLLYALRWAMNFCFYFRFYRFFINDYTIEKWFYETIESWKHLPWLFWCLISGYT